MTPHSRMKMATDSVTNVHKEVVPEYGTVTSVEFGPNGISGRCVIHPDDLDLIRDVSGTNNEVFTDEQNTTWVVSQADDETLYFSARGGSGLSGLVKKTDLFTPVKQARIAKRAFIKGYVPQMKDLTKIGKNLFECKSTEDFWRVGEDGKLLRLVPQGEIDNGETLVAAPADDPEGFLKQALVELNLD